MYDFRVYASFELNDVADSIDTGMISSIQILSNRKEFTIFFSKTVLTKDKKDPNLLHLIMSEPFTENPSDIKKIGKKILKKVSQVQIYTKELMPVKKIMFFEFVLPMEDWTRLKISPELVNMAI